MVLDPAFFEEELFMEETASFQPQDTRILQPIPQIAEDDDYEEELQDRKASAKRRAKNRKILWNKHVITEILQKIFRTGIQQSDSHRRGRVPRAYSAVQQDIHTVAYIPASFPGRHWPASTYGLLLCAEAGDLR